MPLTFRNLHAVIAYRWVKEIALNLATHVIVEHHEQLASHNHCGFSSRSVPVNRDYGSRQEHVEHALRLVIAGVSQVHVHAQTRTGLRLLQYIVKKIVVDNHSKKI